MMVFAILVALATSLALFFSLGSQPAAAQDKKESSDADAVATDDVTVQACLLCDAIIERFPSTVNFGKVKLNRTKQLDVTVRGLQEGCTAFVCFGGGIGTPSLSGAGASAYSIVNNGCSNVSLNPGDTCKITLAFNPTKRGLYNATLTIPPHENGFTEFQGGNTVELSGKGVKRR
jgi:hypothetical protein